MPVTLMEGNEAVARGALAAGCRFFAGYPITPASSIYHTILNLLPPQGGIVLQGEDEIASIGLCLGASMSGFKAMTATSGPGISLYSENISLAIGSEIPLVVVNVQRLGPSTGSATRGADGDVQFMRWSNTGGLPVIVLAPVNAADCYTLTIQAFNLAERFRCPVMVASNKEIGLTRESVDLDGLKTPPLVEREYAPDGQPYLPFRPMGEDKPPYFLPIGGRRLSRQTSSTHGENGYITTDPAEIRAQIDRLEAKLTAKVNEFTFYEADIREGAQTLILTYGVTARSARRAVMEMEAAGRPVSLLTLKTLWPVPEERIRDAARGHDDVLVVEMNQGQYVREVQRVLKGDRVRGLGWMDGTLIPPRAIKEAVNG